MTDPSVYVTIALSGLAGLAILAGATLHGWRGWLALKRQELALHDHGHAGVPATSAAARIEMADLKERLRKLEAIAAGVEL